MTQKPIWLLDVDGVINAVCAGTPSSKLSGWNDWRTFKSGLGFRIWFSPSLIDFIVDVHTSEKAEVRWLTTWEEQANEHLIGPLNMPRLEILGPRDFGNLGWWKFPLARDLVPNGRPLIWTDDDLAYSSGTNEDGITDWLESRGPTLPISPNPHIGTSRAQTEQIAKFLDR